MNRKMVRVTVVASIGATLALVGTAAFAAKPTPPPDPCVSPNLVTEATFPSFMFGQTVELSKSVYGTGIFLADASGKCKRMIGTWSPQASTIGDFRYDANRDQAMILAPGPGGFVAMTSTIGFGLNGPTASTIGTPIFLLDPTALPLPADLAAAGWVLAGSEQFLPVARWYPGGPQADVRIRQPLHPCCGIDVGVQRDVRCRWRHSTGRALELLGGAPRLPGSQLGPRGRLGCAARNSLHQRARVLGPTASVAVSTDASTRAGCGYRRRGFQQRSGFQQYQGDCRTNRPQRGVERRTRRYFAEPAQTAVQTPSSSTPIAALG